MSEDDYKYALRLAEIPGKRSRATWGCPTGLSTENVRLVCEALLEANKDGGAITVAYAMSRGSR